VFHPLDKDEAIMLAVETAQPHIALRSSRNAGGMKRVRAAIDALGPYESAEIPDRFLCFKRDVVKARITSARGGFEQAIAEYGTALRSLDAANDAAVARIGKLRAGQMR
jgi:hypothetical protein